MYLPSGKNLFDDLTMNVGQALLPPAVTIRQLFMIETELMKDRRMQIVNRHRIGGDLIAEFVRFPVSNATFKPPPAIQIVKQSG